MNSVLRNPTEREIMQQVRQKVFSCGDPKRGAISRIQEYLASRGSPCSRTTIKNCLTFEGEWKFSPERIKLLGDMITEGFSLDGKFSTGRPREVAK